MASLGRGRGWPSHKKDQILHRPGGLPYTNSIVKEVMDRITIHDIHQHIWLQLVQEIVDLMNNTVDKENLKEACDILWKKAILDDKFTTKIATIFSDNKVALIEDDSKDIIRSRFLRFLQDNYTSREKNRIENRKTFANIVLLHAEVYYRMKLSDGNRLKILAEPLVYYMEDLLQDNPKENIYFTLIQVLRCGKDLYIVCPEQLENLMLTIRQMLVKEDNHSPQNRAALLLMIELTNNNYEIKDTRLKYFYVSNIESLSFEHPFSQEDLKVITELKIENDKQEEVDNYQQITKEGIRNDKSEQSQYSKGFNAPRAIRGSGTFDTKKNENLNTKLNSIKIGSPKQNNNKSFWDHDDRFHRNYE